MNFYDFHLRAWVSGGQAQVLVHSSPAGVTRKPFPVAVSAEELSAFRGLVDQVWDGPPGATNKVMQAGARLADILLPPRVRDLLDNSLNRIKPDDGLRLRLCLDDELSDLPWEFMYRHDVGDEDRLDGFVALNSRVSIVREAPSLVSEPSASDGPQRLVFAGVPYVQADGSDLWRVRDEYGRLVAELRPVIEVGLLSVDPFHDAAGVSIEEALAEPATFFHYSGHADEDAHEAYLSKAVADGAATERLSSRMLGIMLRRARTRLAVFSACNSGRWRFVKPLLEAGLPALVGTHGMVSAGAAIWFCQILYRALALGLSLDEATTWARMQVLSAGGGPGRENVEWGSFVVYMPAGDGVLIPKSRKGEVREQQAAARAEREQTVFNVTNNIITQNIESVQSGGSVVGVNDGRGSYRGSAG